MKGIYSTAFEFHEQTGFYKGKVRDVFYFGELMAVVTTDRISAFDVVMPVPIPHKGQILNEIAYYFLESTKDIVKNWTLSKPHPNVTIGVKCQTIPIEMVVRGYLAGHAWRVYESGKRELCGQILAEGLKQSDRLPMPLITPSTKAVEGHDEDTSEKEILEKQIVDKETWDKLCEIALALYRRGHEMAEKKGLLLVDTKYEFGISPSGEIVLIDEVHTPDSSRYFIADGYSERQSRGEEQKQLSKEFFREWLMERGFPFKTEEIPAISEDDAMNFSLRYQELYNRLMPEPFVERPYENRMEDVRTAVFEGIKQAKTTLSQ